MAKKAEPKGGAKKQASTVQYATFALSIIAVALLAYIIFFPPQQVAPPGQPTPVPTATPACAQATPIHTAAEAKDYLSRVMATYKEMIRAEVPEPVFNPCDRVWTAVVRMPTSQGETRAYVRINDGSALLLDNTYLEIVKPAFVTEQRVVTNGTLFLPGKINCSLTQGKARMMEFSDPYCPSCIVGDDKIDAFRQLFNSSIEFEYHVLPSTMQVMENSYGREDVNRFAYYIVCTQEQGVRDAFKPCATQKYRAKGVQVPLSKDELDSCLPAGLNRTRFDTCVQTAFSEVAFDKSMAETYGVTETPVVLFDCQYRIFPEFLQHGFCRVYPTAAGCQN